MRRAFTQLLLGVIVLGLALGAAFGAGTLYGRHSATAAAAPAAQQALVAASGQATPEAAGATGRTGRFAAGLGTPVAGRFGQGLGGGGFAAAARAVSGTIAGVSGQQVTITTAAGASVTVDLDAATRVGTVQRGELAALKAGDTVIVTTTRAGQGAQGGQGGETAQTASVVLILPGGFQP